MNIKITDDKNSGYVVLRKVLREYSDGSYDLIRNEYLAGIYGSDDKKHFTSELNKACVFDSLTSAIRCGYDNLLNHDQIYVRPIEVE